MVNDSAKIFALVVTAIRNLRELKGSTSKEILNYISNIYDISPDAARRQMQTALKRGVAYGILKKNGGHYILPTNSEMRLQEIAEQEVNLLDICRKTKMQKKMGCKCKKRRRRRRRRRRTKKYCRCKRKKSRRRKRRRRRRKKKRCKCGGIINRRDQCRMKRAITPRTVDNFEETKSMELPIEAYEDSERSSVSSVSSKTD
ncbi:protamine-like protein [Osmia bicornis bicornis]|uniref:protamine-like protein n=1 Tax=Osmia bicornis bicornis TaxID=1437191 RepID=UPI0010F67F6E|nr:protamine-like protein [Osmia bicornis bicornis]